MKTQMQVTPGIVVLLVLILVISGCGKDTNASVSPRKPPEVGIMVVQPQKVTLTTELPGRTAAHLIAEVRPQVGGIIQKRLFVEGSDVKEGQILYQIDPARYREAYHRATATLAEARANLTTVRLREERYRELVKINAVSRQDYDDTKAALKQAEAKVEAARADQETARINLDYTGVKAPISGRIGRSAVTTGALVTASQAAPLAVIQQLDPIYVDVTQSSAEMLRMKLNLASGMLKSSGPEQARVRLVLEDGTPYPLPGRLRFSEVSVEESTGSVTLRNMFPNPDKLLLPGMFVRAVLEEGINENAILVPQRGVTRNPGGEAIVMVASAENTVEQRVIKVSRTVGDRWLVTEGLAAGDRIILEGIQKAPVGTVVTPVLFRGESELTTPALAANR
ncbi:efflux pump, RND family, membrane fusion lipoprotein [Syntrophotalea carbinolica DSM 2380]|uniref:Efflux pump, RND family, membrane fusion lipoprotein n=1 Tax=Syntrophotalea carbinolica (strain DSM 2380 / NBRC 103641 / GraBd1) TaxID=338963 RepID=Q3A7U7_SYNC1|nr:efflux RND transporter periplasmic adaptor subunit [Syntrophotalea carbinolica]ABA87547.1 efflux pump, RND family, membrane fusion lipoprotein [Syntrophotalea carbinolica DSM 2380]